MARETRLMMGMPITVQIVDTGRDHLIEEAFAYFREVDLRFSLFKPGSEICGINRGDVAIAAVSPDMREVLSIAERTKRETHGYFDIKRGDGTLDTSGIVKGWAIRNVADHLRVGGCSNFYVDAGGDIQSFGKNPAGLDWRVGIRNPFNETQIIKAVIPNGKGIATSGAYVRGDHIYNPHRPAEPIKEIASLTVIGPDVLEADRFATGAFAMGKEGIGFIEATHGLEGYMVDANGVATQTSGFGAFVTT